MQDPRERPNKPGRNKFMLAIHERISLGRTVNGKWKPIFILFLGLVTELPF